MSNSIQVGQVRFDTFANRPSLTTVAAGFLFYATDTGSLYQVVLDGTPTKIWLQLSGAGSGVWGKYVVSNAAPDGPIAPYTTIASAIAAAIADGRGQASQASVLVMPGTYTEDLTFVPGVHLVGLGAGGSQDGIPMVTLVGNHTAPDIEGDLIIEGIDFQSAAGSQLLIAGLKPGRIQVRRCRFLSTGAITHCVLSTNSQVTSVLLIEDSKLTPDAASTDAISVSNSILRLTRTVVSASAANKALEAPAAADTVLTDCDVTGWINKAAGTLSLRRVRINSTHADTIEGGATVDMEDVTAPAGAGVSIAAGITVDPRREWHSYTFTRLTGAGPHNLTAENMSDLLTVETASTVNLPTLGSVIGGMRVTFRNWANLPTDVAITPFGAETIDLIAGAFHLLAGKSITLQAHPSLATWVVVTTIP